MEAEALSEDAWSEIPLSALASANITYGVVQPGSPVANGVPMIRVNNFEGHSLDLRDVTSISPEIESKYERTRIRAGDILITVVGSVGQVAIAPSRVHGWNIARAVALIRPIDPDQTRWISHFLRSPVAQHRMGIAANTTVQTTVNLKDLRSMLVPMPPEPVRRGISELLGALDDRIDLLRQTNATLEAISQALFKSWFLDFDPVRAKANGREPEGMNAATAALFPGEFEDEKLGSIPKDWRSIAFGDVACLSKGTVNPLATPEVEFEHYSLPAFDAGQLPVREAGSAIKSNKTPVPSGAVLVSKLNPHIPRIWLVGKAGANAVCSTEFLVWAPKAPASSAFAYCLASSPPFNSAMRRLVTGTSNSHQRVKSDQLGAIRVCAASDEALDAFATIASPLLQRMLDNRQQAATLAQLRDTLLPRLISGKLRLPEAEREVEAAA